MQDELSPLNLALKYVRSFLISNFRRVRNVVCFLLGNSAASEFYTSKFQNTVCSIFVGLRRWNGRSVPKHWHIKYRCQGITQKKAYSMWGHLKLVYAAMNWMAWNHTVRNQTKACITKSREVCPLVRYYAAQSSNSKRTFWHNLLIPASRVKKYKTENRAWGMLTDIILL